MPEGLEAVLPSAWAAEFWKISSREGTSLETVSGDLMDFLANSLAKAALVDVRPCSEKKVESAEIKFGGSAVSAPLLAFVCFIESRQ